MLELVVLLLLVVNVLLGAVCWVLWVYAMKARQGLQFLDQRQTRILHRLGTGKWPEDRCPERDRVRDQVGAEA